MNNTNVQVNIVMHSFNAIEARAKKAAQMRIEGNEYDPLFDPVAHHIFKKAYEKEAEIIEEIIEEELLYQSKLIHEPVAMRFKHVDDKRWQFCQIQNSELLHEDLLKEPLYTQQQMQLVTINDITNEMQEYVENIVGMTANWDCANPKEIVAAAINAWIINFQKNQRTKKL
jgi:hypothetical protein